MTETEAAIYARVAKGAAFLDAWRPGWFQKINVTTLDLSNTCLCVLGQLEGGFWEACYRLGWVQRGSVVAGCRPTPKGNPAHELGFNGNGIVGAPSLNSDSHQKFYRVMTDAWLKEIAVRLYPSEEPQAVDAVDPQAADPGTPSTRA
jgi:hypothetical protein